MFDTTIKVEINRVPVTFTNENVKELFLNQQDYETLKAKHDELQRRLALANAKLKAYGHISEF